MSKPFEEGRGAGHKCIPLRCNPYRAGSIAFAQWTYGWDAGKADLRPHTHDYGFDIFTLHVIDYHLWLADLPIRRYSETGRALYISPADWSR